MCFGIYGWGATKSRATAGVVLFCDKWSLNRFCFGCSRQAILCGLHRNMVMTAAVLSLEQETMQAYGGENRILVGLSIMAPPPLFVVPAAAMQGSFWRHGSGSRHAGRHVPDLGISMGGT